VSDFALFTRTPDAVLPLLGPALEQRLPAIRKPYLEVEGRGDLLAVTRRSWIEPNHARALLEIFYDLQPIGQHARVFGGAA